MIASPVNESNGIVNPEAFRKINESIERSVCWSEKGLKILRLRLLSDRDHPVWDVSYCIGQLPDGEYVEVRLPFSSLPKGRGRINGALIAYAKKQKVYARGLGLFDGVISTISM